MAAINLAVQYKRLKVDADSRRSFSTESEAQMDNLQRQIVKIELELVESRNMVSFLEKECDRLKNSNQEVVNLRTQVSQRDEILQDKSMLISTLQNQIKVMQAEKVDADQATFVARNDLSLAEETIKEKSVTIEKLMEKLSKLKKTSQVAIEQRDQDAVELARSVADMRQKLSDTVDEKQRIVHQLHIDMDSMKKSHEESISQHKSEIEAIKSAFDESTFIKNARISKLTTELTETQTQLASALEKNQELQSESKRLSTQQKSCSRKER